MPDNLSVLVVALALAGPVHAKTIAVAPGDGAQARLQEALIVAQPGDVVELAAGRFALSDGLSLDVKGVTLRGAGMDASVLDFSHQQGSGAGLLVSAEGVTLRDFAVENARGDGIKSKAANNIVYYRVRVSWTGGPKASNGAYGLYPVESDGVLIDGALVEGASDAGIYVGQSRNITIRHSAARFNVAGIEIENSSHARVTGNLATHNAGGILVFDLPNLPVKHGGDVVVDHNLVLANDTANFAPRGNIVASVPTGTGVMVMANTGVLVADNVLADNATAQVLVVAFPKPFTDKDYDPYPHRIRVGTGNSFARGGTAPDFPGGAQLAKAFGGALPPVLWDGLNPAGDALAVADGVAGLNLNLPRQGAAPTEARPAPLLPRGDAAGSAMPGAPPALDGRITP
jgi:parallel beta-helix repeat protein